MFDPQTVSVLLAEVPRRVVVSPLLLAQYGGIDTPHQLTSLPWISVSTFYQHNVSLVHQRKSRTGDVLHFPPIKYR
ncbi:LysR family transcriptional regulator [Salmonella bongori]|nr:LysR family transcriptional regulator [Salmonella bongori]